MFDPHIYACQSFISGSTSNPTIQSSSMINDGQLKNNFTPTQSPQKSKHVNSNTVIPIQSATDLVTQSQQSQQPQRKQSNQEDDGANVTLSTETAPQPQQHNDIHVNNIGSGSNSGENSRKTSTISDYTSSECTPENTILTPRQDGEYYSLPGMESQQVRQSPARKLSRFLVSPTVIETANKELIVQEDVTPQNMAASSQQHQLQHQMSINGPQQIQQPQYQQQQSNETESMNINEESYQKIEVPQQVEAELVPQHSIGFKMPETLEQLKIELENITHAHVTTKQKEAMSNQQLNVQPIPNSDAADLHDDNTNDNTISEAQIENSTEHTSTDLVITTGDNTSVYNSRRTSADMMTNPTDVTSTASGVMDYDENLVSEATDDINVKLSAQPQNER